MIETVTCPGCAASFPGSPALMGKRVRCRKCKQEFVVPHDASGLEFLDDEEDCGLEFFDDPPVETQLATIDDDLGLAAAQQAPTALLQQAYFVPAEPKQAPRREYNIEAIVSTMAIAFGLVLLIIGWLTSGGDDKLYLAFYVMGGLSCFVPIAYQLDKRLVEFEGYHQFRFVIAIVAVIGNLLALLIGGAGE